jgi:hypothetical protein
LRLPNSQAVPASYVPRLRLGGYLSIVNLMDGTAGSPVGTLPGVVLSNSLRLGPIAFSGFGVEITDFADPAYGPTIRLRNSDVLFPGEGSSEGAYFLVSLGIAENKDEDWTNLGHA